jgi:hypothetical protein
MIREVGEGQNRRRFDDELRPVVKGNGKIWSPPSFPWCVTLPGWSTRQGGPPRPRQRLGDGLYWRRRDELRRGRSQWCAEQRDREELRWIGED